MINSLNISIIVPFRNEEKKLPNCIKSLLSQKNTSHIKWEILFGNDQSTDNSLVIVEQLTKNHQNTSIHTISHQEGTAKAKANVLAQLIKKSNGQYIIIADADMVFPSTWLAQYSYQFKQENYDIITGFTIPSPDNLFNTLQYVEWSWAMTWMKIADIINSPLTTMGNNMAFRKDSYQKTGGYESLPFSITEDYQLFKEIILKEKGNHFQFFDQKACAFTQAQPSIKALLNQRKRWLYAALNAHKAIPYLVWILSIAPILLLIGILMGNTICTWILMGKGLLDICTSLIGITKSFNSHKKYTLVIASLILFEPYLWLVHLTGLIKYQLNKDFEWKNRAFKYNKNKAV